jgi:hypothetical protein
LQKLGKIPTCRTEIWARRTGFIASKNIVLSYPESQSFVYMTTTNVIKQEKTRLVEFGVCMPKETVERIEAVKGPYITRGKYILKAVDKLLAEEEEKDQRKKNTTMEAASK